MLEEVCRCDQVEHLAKLSRGSKLGIIVDNDQRQGIPANNHPTFITSIPTII